MATLRSMRRRMMCESSTISSVSGFGSGMVLSSMSLSSQGRGHDQVVSKLSSPSPGRPGSVMRHAQ